MEMYDNWDEDEHSNNRYDNWDKDEYGIEEEFDPREYEDGVDEEMEATLYSLIHYKCDETMADAADDPVNILNSVPGTPYVFSVTPLQEEHSNRPSMSQAPEKIHFDSTSDSGINDNSFSQPQPKKDTSVKSQKLSRTSDSESSDENPGHPRQKKGTYFKSLRPDTVVLSSSTSDSESSDENPGQPRQKKGTYLKSLRPDIVILSSSTSDSESSDDNSGHVQQNKAKFDMEAELGIRTKSQEKKQKKMKHDKNTPHQASKSPSQKFPVSTSTLQTTSCVKTGESAPSTEKKDYTETLNQLLTDRPRSKKVKDIIEIKSGSSSSSESESESGKESESSSTSDSESDIEVLGSATSDKSSSFSASKQPLDLNWNVTSSDRHTIETIEKRSSRVDESLWKVNDADLEAFTKSTRSRYYSMKEVRCHNCDKEGHLSKVCPVPKKRPNCGLCGMEGHVMQRCRNRLCFNCSQPGHRGYDCPQPKRSRFNKCARCLMKGHTEDQCPDLWRQYHLTTTTAEDLTPTNKIVNPLAFCCNCAKKGHFAFECKQERMDTFSSPTSPFIARYDAFLSKKTKGKFGNSSRRETRSADWESEDTPRGKRFKASHHHKAPQQTWRHQELFPRGSKSSGHGGESRGERYFSAQPSSDSRAHHGAPSSYKSQQWRGNNGHYTASTWRGRRQGRPHLSGFTKALVQSFLPVKKDQQRDGPGKVDSHSKSGKKQSRRAGEKDEDDSCNPTPPKKRKWQRKKKESCVHKGKYTSQGKSGIVTSSSGFRTTRKALNYNHNSRNAQQK